jgi:hypothetical protein
MERKILNANASDICSQTLSAFDIDKAVISSSSSNKVNLKSKALSRASLYMKMEHKFTSGKSRRALFILRKIHRKMKRLSKAANSLEVKQMFASARKTRRARYYLRKISLKMEVLSKAAYRWRKHLVASAKLQRPKKIIYGDWRQEFYKLPAELRVMIWNEILLPGETNDPMQMPNLVTAFRSEKEHIMYGEVLEIYFKVTTLDVELQQFTGGLLQRLNTGYATQRFYSSNLKLTKLVYPLNMAN